MNTSQNGINLIKQFEGCRLEAYQCSGGIWTIGYGHTGADVVKGRVITQSDAQRLLKSDLNRFETAINTLLNTGLNQNQFDARVSFIYNIGINAFKTSTMYKLLKTGDYTQAANEFDRWIYAGHKALPGLVKRRKAEKELFLKGI